jgi:hypothetical protein
MKCTAVTPALVLLFLASAGCSFRAEVEGVPPPPDRGPDPCLFKDAGPDMAVCPSTCQERRLVIDRISLPTDSTESEKYAVKHRGRKYNSLGGILALVASQAPSTKIAEWFWGEVLRGEALNLLQLRFLPGATDMGPNATVLGRTAVAQSQKCCSSQDDRKACKAEAHKGCFSGTHTFTAEPSGTGDWMEGSLSGGRLRLGPGEATLRLGYSGGKHLQLEVKHVMITADLTADGLQNGVLSAGVSHRDIHTQVVPWLAYAVDRVYQDPTLSASTKDLLKALFDTDKNGRVETWEMANNGLLKAFLYGDVDLDCDGLKELSMGFGFSAVGAKISGLP